MARPFALSSFAALLVVGVTLGLAPAPARAVDYVRICSVAGTGFFYLPGSSSVCYNPQTGKTKNIVTGAEGSTPLKDEADQANEGVAISLALPNATIDAGHHAAIAGHIGTFGGDAALGLSGAFKATDNWTVDGAAGIGIDSGAVGGRAGVNYSW